MTGTDTSKRALSVLFLVVMIDMIGFGIIIPFLTYFIEDLATLEGLLEFGLWVGLMMSAYSAAQFLFSPFWGSLSDRVGRKPIIACGLILYIAGALVGATANSIWTIIVGRAIQGCGAVSGATLALAADLCRENQRAKITAAIGISIGAAFSVAFVLGPILDANFSLPGIFVITAILGLLAVCILVWCTPSPAKGNSNSRLPTLEILMFPDLRMLFGGVFILHAVLAANFVSVPTAMIESLSIPVEEQWRLYLAVISSSIILVALPIRSFSRTFGMKPAPMP